MGKPVHALATPRPKVPAPSPATSAAATPTEPTPPTETPSDEEEIGNGLIGDFKTESTDINITANTVKICWIILSNDIFSQKLWVQLLRPARKRSPLTTRGGFSSMARSPMSLPLNSASGGTVLSGRTVLWNVPRMFTTDSITRAQKPETNCFRSGKTHASTRREWWLQISLHPYMVWLLSGLLWNSMNKNFAPFTLPGGTVQASVEEDQRGDRENSEDTVWLVHRKANAGHLKDAEVRNSFQNFNHDWTQNYWNKCCHQKIHVFFWDTLRLEIDSVVEYTSTRPKLRRTNHQQIISNTKNSISACPCSVFWFTSWTAGSGNTIPKSTSTMLKLMKPASWIRRTSRSRKKKKPVQFQDMSLDDPPTLDEPKAATLGKGLQQGHGAPVAEREVQARDLGIQPYGRGKPSLW